MFLVGLDPFREGLLNARSSTMAERVQGDVMALPFRQHFDAMGLFDVMEHLEEERPVLEAAHRVLRPGGVLLVTVPANESLWSYFDFLARHKRRYGKEQLRERLVGAGFEIQFLSIKTCSALARASLRHFSHRGRPSGRAVEPSAPDSDSAEKRPKNGG